jgi:uncharacterized protein (TIGR02246 family)
MLRKLVVVLSSAFLILLAVQAVASDRAADEKAIRDLDAAWAQAAQSKDPDKASSFYADDASMLPAGGPMVTGKAQLRETWAHFMATPGYALEFAPTKIVISKSGDMAYDVGTTKFTMNDASGKPQTDVGKYVGVWQKRDGKWMAVVDTFNSNK